MYVCIYNIKVCSWNHLCQLRTFIFKSLLKQIELHAYIKRCNYTHTQGIIFPDLQLSASSSESQDVREDKRFLIETNNHYIWMQSMFRVERVWTIPGKGLVCYIIRFLFSFQSSLKWWRTSSKRKWHSILLMTAVKPPKNNPCWAL